MLEIVQKAGDAVGGVPRLAELLECSRQALYLWKVVPVERAIEIERHTGIPRSEIRPDIWPADGIAADLKGRGAA